MKSSLIAGVLILTLTSNVHSKFCPKNEKKNEWWKSLCNTLKYTNETVQNKPDLLVQQYYPLDPFIDGTLFSYDYVNCRTHADGSQSSLFELSQSLSSGLTYDSRLDTFYREAGAGEGFEVVHPNGTVNSTYFKREYFTESHQIYDMALDWVAQNLYFYTDGSVAVVKINEKPKRYRKLFEHEGTYQGKIVLDPNEGYMFLLYKPNIIERRNLDGSHPVRIRVHPEEWNISSMILDPYTKTLFYTVFNNNNGKSSIHYVGLNGYIDRWIDVPESLSNRRITVDKNYVYYPLISDYHTTVVRVDKKSGITDPTFNLTNYNRTVNSNAINLINLGLPQDIRDDHPCRENNGGCEGLCMAIPQRGKLIKLCKH